MLPEHRAAKIKILEEILGNERDILDRMIRDGIEAVTDINRQQNVILRVKLEIEEAKHS